MISKSFDAVKMMRELRDQLSRELQNMTPEEQTRYIREKAAWSKLARESDQQSNTTEGE